MTREPTPLPLVPRRPTPAILQNCDPDDTTIYNIPEPHKDQGGCVNPGAIPHRP